MDVHPTGSAERIAGSTWSDSRAFTGRVNGTVAFGFYMQLKRPHYAWFPAFEMLNLEGSTSAI